MREKEFYWIAGVFEGEGTVSITKRAKNSLGVRAAVEMTDEDIIYNFYNVVGVGHVNSNKKRSSSQQPTFTWEVGKEVDVLWFLTAIRPLMGNRRGQKIDEAVDILLEKLSPRICPGCETFFPPSRINHVYCNNTCYKRERRLQCHARELAHACRTT